MTHGTPTVRQLAELAGVSRTTVSLALRNHPSISLPTRERIRVLADTHGYVLDPLYARLMGQLRVRRADRPTEKLAFLTSWPERDEWYQKAYNDRNYYKGACERAAKLGYEIEVFWAKEPGMTARRLSKILHTRSIRGVIILPLSRPYGHFHAGLAALRLGDLRPHALQARPAPRHPFSLQGHGAGAARLAAPRLPPHRLRQPARRGCAQPPRLAGGLPGPPAFPRTEAARPAVSAGSLVEKSSSRAGSRTTASMRSSATCP